MGKGGCSATAAAAAAAAAAAGGKIPPNNHRSKPEQESDGEVTHGSGAGTSKPTPTPTPPSTTPPPPSRKISPSLLATKVTPDECWLVHQNVVYDATAWLAKHPGGMRTILSNSGRDATAVLLAMHDRKVLDGSLRRMRKVGVYDATLEEDGDERLAVDGEEEEKKEEEAEALDMTTTTTTGAVAAQKMRRERAQAMERDFQQLDDFLVREGWYDAGPFKYWAATIRALVVLALGVGLALWGGGGGLGSHNDLLFTAAADSSQGIIIRSVALVLGSALIGVFFQQVAFFGHDAGHGSITGNFQYDSILGLIVGNALAGIDISWWKSTHNVHHGATNSLHDDPDIQHLPIFCFEEDMVREGGENRENGGKQEGMWSTYHGRFMSAGYTARYLMRFQHLYFYPVMAFARFNLYVQSILHLVRICPFGASATSSTTRRNSSSSGSSSTQTSSSDSDKKAPYDWPTATPAMWTAQVASLSVFYGLWYALLTSLDGLLSAVVCLAVSHVVAGVLHVQILLSHIAMEYHLHANPANSTGGAGSGTAAKDESGAVGDRIGSGAAGLGVSFHELQALTTMDIACPPHLDWLHGGLQFQLEHHLFPRVPKFRLRELIPLVDAIFARHGVPVVRKGFVEANAMVLGHMARVGRSISRVKGD